MSGPRCVLGITGNIATGKSTVVKMLVELGGTHIDADLVYRELVAPGQPLLATLAAHFGSGIVAADGNLDRSKLGAIVFSNPNKLRELDELTHPAVIEEINRRVAMANRDQIIIIDAVKLIESGHADHCDQVWIVAADTKLQVTRLMKRNILSEVEARRRVESQSPIGPKLARADRMIDNSGSHEATKAQVIEAWQAFLASPECSYVRGETVRGREVQG